MTALADLLSPDQTEALKAKRKDLPYRVTKAATDPNPPRQTTPPETAVEWQQPTLADVEVTVINGVEVDLRSEARIQTACADCDTPLEVEVKPRGVDLEILTSRPRIAVCAPCGQDRVRGRQGVLVHDARTPKLTENTEEESELDLTKYSNARVAALAVEAREHMVADAADALPAKREKAKRAEAERLAQDQALKTKDRAKHTKHKVWMGEFMLHGKSVPALDLSEVTNLDEAPSAKMRQPYNKALHAAGEPILDRETTTYRVLRKVHKRLWKQAEVAVEAPKPKAEGNRLAADLEPEASAKVEALAKVTGLSLDQARERLASLNLA